MEKMRVALLIGGPSTEHEVSLATGAVIQAALDQSKYEVYKIIISLSGLWSFDNSNFGVNVPTHDAIKILKDVLKIDIVFIAIHGTWGEDGVLQGLLQASGMRHTGSSILTSALAMDKVRSTELFAYHGLATPQTRSVSKKEDVKNVLLPCVIKPCHGGSSVGISVVRELGQLQPALEAAFACDDLVIIQECIQGREVTCAILENPTTHELIALPPTEIIPKSGSFFDYDSKYTVGASEEITPPRMSPEIIQEIRRVALEAHRILGCRGMSRTDMIVRDSVPFVLETNTIPGMTQTSLLPQAAAAYGLSFSELLDWVIECSY